jgi:glyoxylase-like metal-dependent hydrolase (beta-lactamase superfamily II)
MSEILPNIHRIDSQFGGRLLTSYLLAGDQALLVDSGLAHTPQEIILPYLENTHIPAEKIRWLVVTHASGDHFGGNAAIKRRSPQTIITAHKLDAAAISNHSIFIAEHITALGVDGIPVPDMKADSPDFLALHGPETPVDWVVQGGEELELDENWFVKLIHAPGHTPGHLMVFDPLNRALFLGDAIMADGVPDLEGRLVMPPHYFEVDWYLQTIENARALLPEYLLATHYAPVQGKAVELFLKSSQAFVARFETALMDYLRNNKRPMDMASIIRTMRDWLGIPNSDYQYGLLVRAHLRKLVRSKQITSLQEHGILHWAYIA